MHGNNYRFDIHKLNSYHQLNQLNFEKDLAEARDVVVCDNTNLMPWQTEPYTNTARKYGYRIIMINFLPRELWKHIKSQIVTPEKPDAHGVSESLLAEFIRDFNTNPLVAQEAEVIRHCITITAGTTVSSNLSTPEKKLNILTPMP